MSKRDRIRNQCCVLPAGVGGLSGETHDRDEKRSIAARERDPVTYTVPKVDATDDAGTIFADESYETNILQAHSEAQRGSTTRMIRT
jgi:hypothetical protein